MSPAPSEPAPVVGSDRRLFFDDFQSGVPAQWTPYAGGWDVAEMPARARELKAPRRVMNQTIAGSLRWTDYQVDARVTIHDDAGKVGLLGRVAGTHHYYELLLGREGSGGPRSWFIRRRVDHTWTTLASGSFDYRIGTPYRMRFSLRGDQLAGAISTDDGQTFVHLGATKDATFKSGRIGLGSYFTSGSFDDVSVVGVLQEAQVGPWGPIAELRDNTNTFPTGKPAGGWYVTPIHATLRASDGQVVLTGFGRKAEANCTNGTGGTQREVGESFVITPSQIDAVTDGDTLLVQPLNEQNVDPAREVLYCAGHNTLADGRIFYAGGTRFPNILPNSNPELGVSYARVYNPATNSFTRINALMKGGQPSTPGMKWYPTQLLMPDSRVLIFGGFHWSSSGVNDKVNLSFEMFDPKVWDANPMADPFTVLTQHAEGQAETPPTRGYTNLFLLPKPVPAGNAGGLARSVALAGGVGKVFLFNHEPGPTGAQRLFARPNALTPNPSVNEKGEGASGLMLPDGQLFFPNGGHDGAGSARSYFYNPYSDSWSTLDLGISRIYGNGLWLPNGTVLLVNGYTSEPGNINDVTNPLGGADGVRKPQIIDPFARTVVTEPAWPEPTGRGYHSFALLLKDGRVLIGGGKDGNHATGCEKNELRIYTPPYLTAGPRPAITNVPNGQTLTVAGAPLTITYTGNVRATRGVALMAPGSITHAFDQGQRYIPLTPTAAPAGGSVTVAMPPTINDAPPGDYLLYVISDLGVPSEGVHVRLGAPPSCVYTAGADTYIEAEQSSRTTAVFKKLTDAARSGGAYVQVDPATTSTSTVPDEGRVMWYDLDVPTAGTYYLWLLASGVDGSQDSFFVSMNGNADLTFNGLPSAWTWTRNATALSLTAGRHTLKVKVRERGTRLDKIRLTTSTSTTPPAGFGGTSASCAGMPQPPAAPSGLLANDGIGQATLSWLDNANNELGFKIERKLAADPVTSFTQIANVGTNVTSYTDVVAPGSYSYRVRATNAAGDSAYSNVDGAVVNLGITNLVVNDNGTGNDGIVNKTQWSVQANFAAGAVVFGDRTYTAGTLSASAAHFAGKPWIRTAADSKLYTATNPPVATATVHGSFVFIAIDNRHTSTFLTNAGYTNQGYTMTVNEGATPRTYNVWRRAITSGTTVTFPTITSTNAAFYFILVE